MSYGVGRRHGWDLAWLWLWCRLATTAPIRPLAWEPPYAPGVALKRQKKQTPQMSLPLPGNSLSCLESDLDSCLSFQIQSIFYLLWSPSVLSFRFYLTVFLTIRLTLEFLTCMSTSALWPCAGRYYVLLCWSFAIWPEHHFCLSVFFAHVAGG